MMETDQSPITPEESKPPEEPQTEPTKPGVAVTGPVRKGLSKPLLVALIAAVLIGGGALAYTQFYQKDDAAPTNSADHVDSDDQENESTEESIPEGYTKFSDETVGISFVYPDSWGTATLRPGEEERMGHLTAGSQKIVTFNSYDKLVVGVASTDWTHDPDMGHGGVGEPGVKTLADAKAVKANIVASNVLVDSATQFAHVTYCADNCSDTPKLQIHFTTSISGNPTYSVIQFYQDGDALSSDFYTDGLVDYEKLDSEDLSVLFSKTDPRFTELQKVADSVKNI